MPAQLCRQREGQPMTILEQTMSCMVIILFSAKTTSRSTVFSSSRMLPGQWYFKSAFIAFGEKSSIAFPSLLQHLFKKYFTSSGISSLRSRRGGRHMETTFSLKNRSLRKSLLATAFSRFRFVADIRRTSTLVTL